MIKLSKNEELIVMIITLLSFAGMMLGVVAKEPLTAFICMLVGLAGDYILLEQE